jgi:hypothetical protein
VSDACKFGASSFDEKLTDVLAHRPVLQRLQGNGIVLEARFIETRQAGGRIGFAQGRA